MGSVKDVMNTNVSVLTIMLRILIGIYVLLGIGEGKTFLVKTKDQEPSNSQEHGNDLTDQNRKENKRYQSIGAGVLKKFKLNLIPKDVKERKLKKGEIGESGKRGLCNQLEQFPDMDYERHEKRAEQDCLKCHENRRVNHKQDPSMDPAWCHTNHFPCGILNTTFKNVHECNEFYKAKGFGSKFCQGFAKVYDTICIDMPWLDIC